MNGEHADVSGLQHPRILVFNGGSSSGKSTLTRVLQQVLPGVWLRLSVDTLIEACPPSLFSPQGLDMTEDGFVNVGAAFTTIERYWIAGLARMAELGAQVLVEDNFVSGPTAQHRWQHALAGIPVGWVGVRCDAATAAEREGARVDRIAGMAERQADEVHVGISYDLEVDSSKRSPAVLAEEVVSRWFR